MRDHTSDFPKLTFKHYCIVVSELWVSEDKLI